MRIELLASEFVVCKTADSSRIDLEDPFTFYAKTDEEISLVCRAAKTPENATDVEAGWRALRICGTLDFGLIGVLSKITGVLAGHGIGVFVLSTFNTDYILVKDRQITQALTLLEGIGYEILEQTL